MFSSTNEVRGTSYASRIDDPKYQFAGKTGGEFISSEDIDKGVEPFQKIRDAVGRKMDIMVELHSMWNLPSAKRIISFPFTVYIST